jgi:hypothetical protein
MCHRDSGRFVIVLQCLVKMEIQISLTWNRSCVDELERSDLVQQDGALLMPPALTFNVEHIFMRPMVPSLIPGFLPTVLIVRHPFE